MIRRCTILDGLVTTTASLERNLRLYPWLQLAARTYFWLPIVVLYFLERFGLDGALRLSAVYYLAVVALEVPLGWLSDRVGRVTTLRLGAATWVAAHSLFVLADRNFAAVAAAQALLAAGYAALSGTDVSFHYDTLEALDRQGDYEVREARAARLGLGAATVATLSGGLLGGLDFRLPFAAALLAAASQLAITMRLEEPPHQVRPRSPGARLAVWRENPQFPLLAWLFAYMVIEVTLQHLDFELAQPYLARAMGDAADHLDRAAIPNGVLVATASAVAALSVTHSVRLRRRLGLSPTLVLLAGIHVVSIVAMAAAVSLAVVPLLTLRSVQTAAAGVLVSAAVAPRVQRSYRATFLSLGSLAGRLGYGLTLVALSSIPDLTAVLRVSAALAVVLLAVLVLTRPSARRRLWPMRPKPAPKSVPTVEQDVAGVPGAGGLVRGGC